MSQSKREQLEQAMHWQVRMTDHEVSAAERRAFFSWLQAAPEHAAAFEHAEKFWQGLAPLTEHQPQSRPAQPNHQPRVVVNIRGEAPAADAVGPMPRHPAGWRRFAAAAASLAALTLSVLLLLPKPEPGSDPVARTRYQTPVGQLETYVLTDGSRLTLGAGSEISVALGETHRDALLTKGDALFEVASDPDRPFSVRAGATRVRVTGTAFEVRYSRFATRVAVLEGAVDVSAGDPISGDHRVDALQLMAGQGTTYEQGVLTGPAAVDPTKIGAWRSDRLVFNDATLAEVIADANRYDPRTISIQGEALKQLRVTTVFDARDVNVALAGLQELFPIEVEQVSADQLLIRPR